jgi:hypothetical protein
VPPEHKSAVARSEYCTHYNYYAMFKKNNDGKNRKIQQNITWKSVGKIVTSFAVHKKPVSIDRGF